MRDRRFLVVSALAVVLAFIAPLALRALTTAPAGSYRGFPPPTPIQGEITRLEQPIALPPPDLADGAGMVLIDFAHANNFIPEELAELAAKINDRGHRVEYLTSAANLEAQLRGADAFIILAARQSYMPEEIRALQRYVARGGRLLLVADPIRNRDINDMNSVATVFGVVYQDDYLYNVTENAGNYLDVIIRDFADTALADDVESIVFFTAHAVRVASGGIAFGDEQTYASKSESPGNQVVVAQTANGQVLALPDMTFLTAPYNSFADNDQFINNITDWLVSAQRSYILPDHPYYLGPAAHIVFADTFLFNRQIHHALNLRAWLNQLGIDAHLRDALDPAVNAVTIGLYEHVDYELDLLLKDEGVAVTNLLDPIPPGTDPHAIPSATPPPPTPPQDAPSPTPTAEGTPSPRFVEGQVYLAGVGSFERAGTTLFHLHREGDVYRLIVLATDETALASGLTTLAGGALDACILTDYTALCRGESGIAPPPTPEPTALPAEAAADIPEILVVSDDDGIPGPSRDTGAFEIAAILGARYKVTVWSENAFGEPLLEDLLARRAVVWTTGDFIELAPSESDAALLAEYVARGGRLFLTGAHIGATWGGTDFYRTVAGAEYLGAVTLLDLEVGARRHRAAASFAPGDVITLEAPAEDADIVAPAAARDAEAILMRGPASEAAGEAALIVGQAGSGRQVYAAFPVALLPQETREALLLDIAGWLAD